MKKYYYICVCIGDYLDCYEDNAYYYSQIGNLQEVNAGEELKTLAPNEIWKRITEDEYNKALANDNYVINYDNIHCIGKCTECQRYLGRRLITGEYIRCDQTTPLYPDPNFKNENAYHACCIINKEYVQNDETLKNAKNINNRKQFFKCIIIYMFTKIKSLIKLIK